METVIRDRRRILLDDAGLPIVRSTYNAVDGSSANRRRPPATMLRSEDAELKAADRRALMATTRDLRRNYATAAWAVRKHLDFVSTFSFQARTGDKGLDADLEFLVQDWSLAENFDAAGRHGMDRFTRTEEACRTIDGDVGELHLADGRLQGIEGDRIRTPTGQWPSALAGIDPERFIQGVHVDAASKALGYAVHRRVGWGGFEFESYVPAQWLALHAYYSDRFDQVRGVSPLSSGLNDFRDVYEAKDYAMARLKIAQLFGLFFTRNAAEPVYPGAQATGTPAADGTPRYEINLSRGPFIHDLAPGDDAKWLETGTPATESREFMTWMLESALKSLDMPYSFYDGSRTNFFGSRAELNHYLASAWIKRKDNQALHAARLRWRTRLWVADGILKLPGSMTADQVAARTLWIPRAMPWWNPVQEVSANNMAIAAATKSRQDVCLEEGRDFEDVVDQLSYEKKRLEAEGLSSEVNAPNVSISETRQPDETQPPAPQKGK